jgi:hypothetical protein
MVNIKFNINENIQHQKKMIATGLIFKEKENENNNIFLIVRQK